MDLCRRLGISVMLVVLILSTFVAAVTVVEQPRITSVDNRWGTVTQNRTEVETRLTIANPLLLRLGDRIATVNYSVSLNEIRVANETDRAVNIEDQGRIVLASTTFANHKISAWWMSHIMSNEITTVSVEPTVKASIDGVDIWRTSTTRSRTVETDLVAPLQSNQRRTFSANGRPMLIVHRTDAHWGTPTAARTPITATASVWNPTWLPLPLTTIEYTVRMNGVVVGRGQAGGETVIRPGETKTITANAAVDNRKLDDWWIRHLQRGERTRMSVDFHAVVALNGREQRIRLDFFSYEYLFETNVLGKSKPVMIQTENPTATSHGKMTESKIEKNRPLSVDSNSAERPVNIIKPRIDTV